MKLVYSREGGLFAQLVQAEATSTDLPTDLQQVANAVLADPASYRVSSVSHNLTDGYQYRLDLQEGPKKVSLTFGDLNVPDVIRPLIHFLQKRTGKP